MGSFLYRHKRRRRNDRASLLVMASIAFGVPLIFLLMGVMTSVPPTAGAPVNHEIGMYDFFFSPQFLTIPLGDTITWHNFSPSAIHTATSNTSAWTEVVLNPGQTSTPITLTSAGNYTYICSIHFPLGFNMWGAIQVVSNPIPEFSSSIVVVAGMLILVLGMVLLGRIRERA